MRAEDLLPDHVNQGQFQGVTVRKGTVGAFLVNARRWCDPQTPADERSAAEHDLTEALPALRALGLFDALEIRDPALRAWLAAH